MTSAPFDDDLLGQALGRAGVLRQMSGTTCGPACLTVAAMMHDGGFAAAVLLGAPGTQISNALPATAAYAGLPGDRDADAQGRFARANDALHMRINRVWPKALGTSPWAVRRELARVVGAPYVIRWINPFRAAARAAAFERLEAAGGLPAALFTGNSWMPRHVVLALPRSSVEPQLAATEPPATNPKPLPPHEAASSSAADLALSVYDPGPGAVLALSREDFVYGTLGAVAWTRPWLVVVPRYRAR